MLLPYIRMIFWYMIILISVSWITDWMMMSLRPRPPLVTERRQMYLMKAGRYIFVLGIEPTSLFHVTPKRHNSVFSSFTHITSWWNFPSVLVNPRTWSTWCWDRQMSILFALQWSIKMHKNIEISYSISQWSVCETTSKVFGFGINLPYQR